MELRPWRYDAVLFVSRASDFQGNIGRNPA